MTADPVEPDDVDPDVDLRHPPQFTGQGRFDTWRTVVVVAAGGGVGGLARLGINTWVPPRTGFPWATFIENVAGCLLIGALMVVVHELSPQWAYPRHHLVRPFLGTGVLGGFTTFSAYTADARALLAGGQNATALLYLMSSVASGLMAVMVGIAVTRRMLPVAEPR